MCAFMRMLYDSISHITRRKQHTALFESEEMPRAFSREVRYLSMRREKSR